MRVPLSYLSFQNVTYAVHGRVILEAFNFDLKAGETLVLLGRSGSGKTTALKLINRMLEPTAGAIFLDGQDVSELDPIELRRSIGYVIQDFGLLPHWTVEQNVGLVPRLKGWPADRRRELTGELLSRVGLPPADMAMRLPHELSGGQKQRVAVARALAAEPKLLLFDEPFGALDPITRHEMQLQFIELRERYRIASVFVTHDLLEALRVGSRIAVLESGKLQGFATPDEFWDLTAPLAAAFIETLPEDLRRAHAR